MKQNLSYIVIEGNIGAGKTTLATKFADAYNAKLILEQFADNPFLPKFYDNPERYNFTLELSFLAARYKQLNAELQTADLFKTLNIADYYFAKSLIFSQSTLPDDEFALYRQLYGIIYTQLPRPGIYVYLHVDVERLIQNIKLRGRDYEQNISKDYLLGIQESYFAFFKSVTDFPIVVVDCSQIDFVNNINHYNQLNDITFNGSYKNGINRITW